MHGTLGAAQLLAINREFEAEAPRRRALNSLPDLRSVLHGNLGADDLGLYIATITTLHEIPVDPDFWQLASNVKGRLS